MRIISQSGQYDVPYEVVAIMQIDNLIYALPMGIDKPMMVAEYSSDEEAFREMTRLQRYAELNARNHREYPMFKFKAASWNCE